MNKVNIEMFLDACRDFEAAVKQKYQLEDNASAYMYLSSLSKFAMYRDEIHVIRTLRNMLAHNNMEMDGKEIIEFSPILLSTLKKITNSINHPTLVKDCMIKNIFTADINDSVSFLFRKMKERGISHIPLLDEQRKLLGVFSQNTIFSYLSETENVTISKADTLEKYAKFLPIDMHENEAFAFVGCEEDIEKAKTLFKRTKNNHKRVVMLFVSKNGLREESVIGILTPWDVIE